MRNNLWPTDIPISTHEGDGLPSPHQVEQLRLATRGAVGCLVGSPGTGKSHASAYLLRAILDSGFSASDIALCAPTGKAAVRLTQSMQSAGIDLRARTIHQLLEIGRNGHDGSGWGFLRNRDNPLDEQFIFCDEGSMIDTNLMADLFDALREPMNLPATEAFVIEAGERVPPRCRRCGRVLKTDESIQIGYGPECAKLVSPDEYYPARGFVTDEKIVLPALPAISSPGSHLLILGDTNQLAPVGHGAPLRDMLAAGVPHGELTEVRRNAGRIVFACRDIKAGRPVEFSPAIDLPNGENLRHVECTSTETADLVCTLLETGVKGFHPVWQTQVIVGLNDKGNCSRVMLNERLQNLLNPDGRGHAKCKFRVGDKVICLRNTWLRPCVPTMNGKMSKEQTEDAGMYRDVTTKDDELYCANGEIGRVMAVGDGSCVCQFGDNPDAPLVRVGAKKGKSDDDGDGGGGGGGGESGGSEADFDLAYAITGHKMQGAQQECVIVVIDDSAGAIADRSWHYTAISRAVKLCVMVGPKATFTKQIGKVNLVKRKTFLRELIEANRKQPETEMVGA